MEGIEVFALIWGMIDSAINIANNVGFFGMFTKKNDEKLRELLKQDTRRILLSSVEVEDVDEDMMILLPDVLPQIACTSDAWEEAKRRIEAYTEKQSSIVDDKVLIVAANRLNLGALFLFGWQMGRNSHRSILFSAFQDGQICLYPTEPLQEMTLPYLTRKLDQRKDRFGAIAVFVFCSRGEANDDPFEVNVKDMEEAMGVSVYTMRYTRSGRVDPKDPYVNACMRIESDIRKARRERCEHAKAPIHVYMQVTSPIALCLGMHLCQMGNVHFHSYEMADSVYHEAYSLNLRRTV